MKVSLVVAAHSAKLAEGVVELAKQMAQGKVAIVAAGGTATGELGTSVDRITTALKQVAGPDGTLILLDLGSAVMATEIAVEELAHTQGQRVIISPAPLVQGPVIAAVSASLRRTIVGSTEA